MQLRKESRQEEPTNGSSGLTILTWIKKYPKEFYPNKSLSKQMTVFDTLKFLKYPYLMKSPSYFVVRLEQENHAISKTSSSMT